MALVERVPPDDDGGQLATARERNWPGPTALRARDRQAVLSVQRPAFIDLAGIFRRRSLPGAETVSSPRAVCTADGSAFPARSLCAFGRGPRSHPQRARRAGQEPAAVGIGSTPGTATSSTARSFLESQRRGLT